VPVVLVGSVLTLKVKRLVPKAFDLPGSPATITDTTALALLVR
jgi:hypothetical protein